MALDPQDRSTKRSVSVPERVWLDAQAAAHARHWKLSQVVREALSLWLYTYGNRNRNDRTP